MAKSNFVDLGNFVWLDLNEDGIQDSGEPGIENVTVSLVDSLSGQVRSGAETTTDANGYFQLENARWENAYLRFTLPDELPAELLSQLPSYYSRDGSHYMFTLRHQGEDHTLDSNADTLGRSEVITIAEGVESDSDYDAGLHLKPTVISDYVWLDQNGNGQQDDGERGVAGATAKLLDGNRVVATAVSDADGHYELVAPDDGGRYSVQFVLPPSNDYVFSHFTVHNAAGVDDSKDSDANRDTGKTHEFDIASYTTIDDIDAGLFERAKLVSLGDKVWHDLDHDGIQDAGEPGIEGVEVRLTGRDGVMQRTFTDSHGEYGFGELLPDNYQLRFIPPSGEGYIFSDAAQGSDIEKDSNPDARGYTVVTLVTGVDNQSVDAGLYQGVSIGDKVWYDTDADGRQDDGEPGMENITVKLMQGSTVVDSTVTDAEGNYYLNSPSAGDYHVNFELPTSNDYVFSRFTEQDAPGVDDTKDSDANRESGDTHVFSTKLGDMIDHVDAGLFERSKLVSLGDKVWHDQDRDGIQDAGEPGIEGVEVRLLDISDGGKLVSRTFSDSNGRYQFSEVLPGDYRVQFMSPDDMVETISHQGGDDEADSNVDSDGYSEVVNLTPGSEDLSIDAGYIIGATLGDKVWLDTDGNGSYDAAEESGFAGVRVELYDGEGNYLNKFQQTDANGDYLFEGLVAGDYRVKFVTPDGYGLTRQNKGNDALDSDADQNTGFTEVITLAATDENYSVDAGMMEAGSIGDYVWHDVVQDGDITVNGIQDANETGLGGVAVELFVKESGRYVATGRSDVTAEDGSYYFGGVMPGDYAVKFDKDGYMHTRANQGGDDTKDSDADRNSGLAYVAVQAGDEITHVDAGMTQKTTLAGVVWNDHGYDGYRTPDGIQNFGGHEHPVHNYYMRVYDYSEGSAKMIVNVHQQHYYAYDVLPGEYKVWVANYFGDWSGRWSPTNQGNDDTRDSDAYWGGFTHMVHMEEGEYDDTVDVGLTPLAIDLNQDGINTLAAAEVESGFDFIGNGTILGSGWLSSEDGFLAIDNNHNGNIDNISELFGGLNQGDGFAKLARFDSNSDGVVDLNDAQFADLLIWQDANSNKVTDDGELMTLAKAGVASLAVDYVAIPELDENGNLHLERSSATMADGREVDMTDVYFAVAAADAAAAGLELPSMAELLSVGDNLDTLVGAQAESFVADTGVDSYQKNPLAELLDQAMVA